MSVNIKLLFDKIMNDPDIIPPSGQKKEDVAIAIAQQRVKQSENNIKALNMAKSKSSISDFINFIQLEKAPKKPEENTDPAPSTSTNPKIERFNNKHGLSGNDAITEEDGWDDTDFEVANHFMEQGDSNVNNLQMF